MEQVIEDCPHVTKKLLVDTEEDICRYVLEVTQHLKL